MVTFKKSPGAIHIIGKVPVGKRMARNTKKNGKNGRSKPRDRRRDVLRDLGEKVRAFRHERGLTQEALADSLKLSVAYVSLIERGGRNPPYTTVVAIAQALGVSPREICAE